MKLKDFIVEKAICPHLAAQDKKGAIRELVTAMAEAGAIAEKDVDSLVRAIMKREEIGSTGIGKGVAVPHSKHPCADKLRGTVGISHEGVEFSALDGKSVHIIFLLVSPPDSTGPHIKALEYIFSLLNDSDFCRFIMAAEKTKDIVDLLREADQKLD
ncbi:MAG: PTS sugar transporter subunit IIA [Planctomycetes bacterium]|nr:PTS sugar transporter subunit IIA [Planctomycetota bacterium]